MELMDGVTIVDRISVNGIGHMDFRLIILYFIVAFVFSGFVMIITDSLGVGFMTFIMSFLLSFLISVLSSDEHYQYKCTVDSSVTIETLQEQYDIVGIKDGFVILEDKETVDETENETNESNQNYCCCCCHKSTHE